MPQIEIRVNTADKIKKRIREEEVVIDLNEF
jgi:hypothetical protein